MNGKIVLIDGHSILNRAFYGLPDLTNSEGKHTNAVYGFLNILFKILEEEKPEYLTVAFDVSAPTFRHKMFENYKGTRKPMPAELYEQVPLVKEVLTVMGVKIVEKAGFEADDVLGSIARLSEKNGLEVSLVSGDRDLLQLASDRIKIRIPKTKKGKTEIEDYYSKDVLEKYLVTPAQFIDLKALMGDVSDNIPGVPGIGEKTASKIISTFGSMENAYGHVEEVLPKKARENMIAYREQAILSRQLSEIKTDCELDYQLEQAKLESLFNENVYQLFKRLEFKNLLSRFQGEMEHNNEIEKNFWLIDSLDGAEVVFQKIKKLSNETELIIGLEIVSIKDKILSLGIAFAEDEIYEIRTQGFIVQDYLKEFLQNLKQLPVVIAVLNLKQAIPFLDAKETDAIFDLGIAGYLLNPLKDTYHYDDIARDYLGYMVPSREDLIGKSTCDKAVAEKPDEYQMFCCYSAYLAYQAYPVLMKKLLEENMSELYIKIEMPLVYTLYDMESSGIRVEKEALKKYGDNLGVQIVKLERQIYELAGESFNINSPKQLGVILFEKLNLPFAKKTKTGYSTSAEILEKLRCEDPIVGLILEYRQVTKLKSTYADGMANYIEEDGKIHSKFNQTITATGRISSTEPNLQNIPIRMELGREIRKVFVPEEGFVFLDADYSQIELRVLAHMSNDERLIEAYKKEQDIHRITASEVFHTPLDEVSSLQRSNAKAVNFGIVYGISSFSLGQDLNITKKEADQYIKKYFETYPKVKLFLDELVENAKKNGYVTSLFHRKRPIPELASSNFMQRSFGERVAMNSPIQGTAADIIKIAMIQVNRILKQKKMKSRLVLQVHDELLIETKKEEISEVIKLLEEEMHQAAKLSVPLEIDVNQGDNWYEAK